jgi:hypothetical protein
MQTIRYISRAAWAVVAATLYKLAFAPVAIAGFVLVPLAIWFGVTRPSRLTGRLIFTAPDWLSLYGNEQDGYDPEWAVTTIYKGWPTFWRRYAWAAWRNKVRNLPFVPSLAWLHEPPTRATFDVRNVLGVRVEIWRAGWMCELKASRSGWFLDVGPRLDQGFEQVSWAFRLIGRR